MAEAEDKKPTTPKRKAPVKKRTTTAKATVASTKRTRSTKSTKAKSKPKSSPAKKPAPQKTETVQPTAPKSMSWSGAFWHITALILFAILASFLALLTGGLSIALTLAKAADIEIAQITHLRDLISHWLKDCLKFILEDEADMPFPFKPLDDGARDTNV